jgi:hypothetical protein
LEDGDKPYFQSIGTSGFWMPEQEYRHLGDIDLSTIPQNAVRVVVREKHEILRVNEIFKGEIFSFYS